MSFQYPLISESDEATFCLKINVRNHKLLEVFRTAPIATCVQRMLLGMQPGLGRVRTLMMLALVLDQSRPLLICFDMGAYGGFHKWRYPQTVGFKLNEKSS